MDAQPRSWPCRLFPFLRWLPPSRETVRSDLLAGLTVAFLLIPQAMAYAQLAGLPPHYGLYTAVVPVILAALFGWCSQLHTGPVAMTSLLTAAVLADAGVGPPETPTYIAAAIALAFLAGLIRLVFGLLRLAAAANFLAHPAIVGFTNAAALIIAASQLPLMLRLPAGHSGSSLRDFMELLRSLPQAHLPSLAFGLAALLLLAGLARRRPRWPGALIVVALSILGSWILGFAQTWGGEVVGPIPAGLPEWKSPSLSLDAAAKLLPGAAMIGLIGFLEVLAICKALSAKTRETLDLNQELIGQGVAGLLGSFAQCHPVSGSFSRSALNLHAGARTGLSSVISGLCVLAALLALTPLLWHLPRAVLGAVILVAVAGLVDPARMVRVWRTSRSDGCVAATTFIAALLFAPRVVEGVLLGAGLAIGIHLFRVMRPHVARLSPEPRGALQEGGGGRILGFRFDGRLIFLNASRFEEEILRALAEHPRTDTVLIVAEGINEIDSSGTECLRNVILEMRASGIRVAFSGVKDAVREVMERGGLKELIEDRDLFASAAEAFESLAAQAESPERAAGGPSQARHLIDYMI